MSVEKLQKEVSRWEGRLSELHQKGEQEMARANALETERRTLALDAAGGSEKAQREMTRLARQASEHRAESDNLGLMATEASRRLETLRVELAAAQQREVLAGLRQACERRAEIGLKVEKAYAELIELLREVKTSSQEIVALARQLNDRFDSRDARHLFTTPLGYLLWVLKRELGESAKEDWRFEPPDPKAGVRGALVGRERLAMQGILAVCEPALEAVDEAPAQEQVA